MVSYVCHLQTAGDHPGADNDPRRPGAAGRAGARAGGGVVARAPRSKSTARRIPHRPPMYVTYSPRVTCVSERYRLPYVQYRACILSDYSIVGPNPRPCHASM